MSNCLTILRRIKSALQTAFGSRLKAVIIYGSEARGQAGPQSDIDVLVLLTGPVSEHDDSWTCIRALYPLVMELDRPIHAWPADAEEYERSDLPIYREIRREGIPA